MKAILTQMFMLDNKLYNHKRVWLNKEIEIPPIDIQKGMNVKVFPYLCPQPISNIEINSVDGSVKLWLETKEYGTKITRKEKKRIKKKIKTIHQIEFEEAVELFKDYEWIEEKTL